VRSTGQTSDLADKAMLRHGGPLAFALPSTQYTGLADPGPDVAPIRQEKLMPRVTSPRPALTLLLASTLLAGTLLGGCAPHPAVRSSTPAATTHPTTGSTNPTRSTNRMRKIASPAPAGTPTADADLPQTTGIAACDDYLSSYMACHRAAHIFVPDQLPARYQAMRLSLLRDSMNPDVRPQLAARCNSLASTLRQALHGKSCDVNPATSSSSP
jgi:hypothetical protein